MFTTGKNIYEKEPARRRSIEFVRCGSGSGSSSGSVGVSGSSSISGSVSVSIGDRSSGSSGLSDSGFKFAASNV